MRREVFTGNITFSDGVSERFQFYKNNERISYEEVLETLNRLYNENTEFKLTSNLFSDRELKRLKKENKELKFEKTNAYNILNDFMDMMNQMQYYFKDTLPDELDHKDFEELNKLAAKSRDLLQNMDVTVKCVNSK